MSLGKAVLIGGIGFGLVAWFIHSKPANAASSLVPPPVPPAGATVETIANPVAGTGMPTLKRTSWAVAADASGQQSGTMILLQNAANPNDWVLSFRGDAGGAGIISYAQTPNGGLLAQAAAGGQ